MSTITIHTNNEKQINLLQALLDELNIEFEITVKDELTDWQKKQIKECIQQADNGDFFSFEESEKIIEGCFK
jgi:predicted transcriptional regulator